MDLQEGINMTDKTKMFYSIVDNINDRHSFMNFKIKCNHERYYDLFVIEDMSSLLIPFGKIINIAGMGFVNGDGNYERTGLYGCTYMILSYTYDDLDHALNKSYGVYIDSAHMSDMDFIENKIIQKIGKDYNSFLHRDHNICIAGSLSVSDKIKEVADYYKKEGYTVYYAKEQFNKSLFDVDLEFIKMINWCDTFVIIPKEDGSIGDSVTYEKAIAKFLNKKIITWNDYKKKG